MKLVIETSSREPVFAQVVAGIKLQIAQGHLCAGDRLPAVRALALELMLNPNTVQKAYNQLIMEGVIYSKRGVGVFVADIASSALPVCREHIDHLTERYISDCIHAGMDLQQILATVNEHLDAFKDGKNE